MTAAELWQGLARLLGALARSLRDLLPILLVVGAFQVLVFRLPLADAGQILLGLAFLVTGLALVVFGLQHGLLPVGEIVARDLARKGSLPWLLGFAFALGFGASFAEPSLTAIAGRAAELAAAAEPGLGEPASHRGSGLVLRLTVAMGVGVALVIGVLRIVLGLRLHPLILAGYALVLLLTPLAPRDVVALAYDSGGFTLTTLTVPLAAALGVGLASNLKGRMPLTDGFGLVALGTLVPILFVLILGMVTS